MHTSRFLILLLFTGLLLAGCAGTPIRSIQDERVAGSGRDISAVDIRFVKQQTKYSCGAAALESVMRYWNVAVEQDWLLTHRPPASTRDGYTLGELKAIARNYKLQAFAVRADVAFLEKQVRHGRPTIVPLQTKYLAGVFDTPFLGPLSRLVYQSFMPSYSHYVVVSGFDDKAIWVMDPGYGLRSISRKKFLKEWKKKGNAALLVSS